MARVMNKRSGLVMFYSQAALWSKLSPDELTVWIKGLRRVLLKKQMTLLMITCGTAIIPLRNHLQRIFSSA